MDNTNTNFILQYGKKLNAILISIADIFKNATPFTLFSFLRGKHANGYFRGSDPIFNIPLLHSMQDSDLSNG